jgi:hypothetical protein
MGENRRLHHAQPTDDLDDLDDRQRPGGFGTHHGCGKGSELLA